MSRAWLFIACLLLAALPALVPALAGEARHDADARHVDQLRERYVQAMRRKDAAALAACVTEHFVLGRQGLAPPAGKPATVVGRSEFAREFDTNVFAKLPAGTNPWKQYPIATRIQGDWGFETGNFGPDSGPRAGKPVGSYAWVMRRQADGSWLIAYQTFGPPIR